MSLDVRPYNHTIEEHDYNNLKSIYCTQSDYLLTITLNPELYRYSSRIQLKKTFDNLENILKILCDRYYVVAELTKTSNVHYHGVVSWDKTKQYHKDRLQDILKCSRTLGSNLYINPMISTPEESLRVWEYIHKEDVRTHSVINSKKSLYISPIRYWRRSGILRHQLSQNKSNTKLLDIIKSSENPYEDSDTEIIIGKYY